MYILHRYLIGQTLKYFSIVLLVVLCLFIAVDFLGNMDEFIKSGIGMARALQFVLLKIPLMLVFFIPVGLLLAVLIVFGLMRKNREILALKAAGVGVFRLLMPVLLLGMLLSTVLFGLSEGVAPLTQRKANRIKSIEIRKKAAHSGDSRDIWIKGHRAVYHIHYYLPAEATAFGLTLNFFDRRFRLVRRIDAEKGRFIEGRWELSNLLEQVYDPAAERYDITHHRRKTAALDLTPADLKQMAKKSEEMNYRELTHYIQRIEAEGYDATAYRVDLYAKTAFPLICIIMSILGTGIATRAKTHQGMSLFIAAGIAAAFLYWVFYSFCLSLGRGEFLPPVLSAWTANIVFLSIGMLSLQN